MDSKVEKNHDGKNEESVNETDTYMLKNCRSEANF